MIRHTGCIRESPRTSRTLRDFRRFSVSGQVKDVLQPTPRIRDQGPTPSCVGQAIAACFHGLAGFDASAIELWTDARRRGGQLENEMAGTTLSLAVTSVEHRGVSPYLSGEEQGAHNARASLAQELAADDRRPKLSDYRVTDGDTSEQIAAIVSALAQGWGVVWTTGVTDSFFEHAANMFVADDEVGRLSNGHAMRVFGYEKATNVMLVQNSWGESWGGVMAMGRRHLGCCMVPAELLVASSWEVLVIKVI
jgi:hypothetical protein